MEQGPMAETTRAGSRRTTKKRSADPSDAVAHPLPTGTDGSPLERSLKELADIRYALDQGPASGEHSAKRNCRGEDHAPSVQVSSVRDSTGLLHISRGRR